MFDALNRWLIKSIPTPSETTVVRYVIASAPIELDPLPAIRDAVRSGCTAEYAARLLAMLDAGRLSIQSAQRNHMDNGPVDDLYRRLRAFDVGEAALSGDNYVATISASGPTSALDHIWLVLVAAFTISQEMNGTVYDPNGLEWNPDPDISSATLDGSPMPAFHLCVLMSDDDGVGLLTTKGMLDYGLPELMCENFPSVISHGLGIIANGLARRIIVDALGRSDRSKITPPVLVMTSSDDIVNACGGAREEPYENKTFRIGLVPVRAGGTYWYRIVRPPGTNMTHAKWCVMMVEDVVGPSFVSEVAGDDPELVEATAKARGDLPLLKARFLAAPPDTLELSLKCGFPVKGGIEKEHMWVHLSGWSDSAITGTLGNSPMQATHLRLNQVVNVDESMVEDWMIPTPDGFEGGYSIQVLTRRRK